MWTEKSAEITHNWFYHDTLDRQVIIDWPLPDRVHVWDNAYGAGHRAQDGD